MGKCIDITGKRFGTLTVTDQKSSKKGFVVCICDCGEVKEIRKGNLKAGYTKTCGKTSCRENLRNPFYTYMNNINFDIMNEEDQLQEMINTPFENRRRVSNINKLYSKAFELSKEPRKSKRNSSGYVGVSWSKKTRRWRAQISFRGEYINLGSFKIFDDAVNARKEAEELLFSPAILSKKKFHKKSYKCIDTGIGA